MSGNWNLELNPRVQLINGASFSHSGKERDSAEGCFFESFRMPPGDEDPLTAEVDKEGQDVCGYTTPDLRRLGKKFLSSTHSSGVDNEALVTMFFSREAAVQLAGADMHFPGRPPAAQPLGAPQPTPSSQRHDGKIRLREFAAILPSKNHDCDLSSAAHSNHRTRKSPLLMANHLRVVQPVQCCN